MPGFKPNLKYISVIFLVIFAIPVFAQPGVHLDSLQARLLSAPDKSTIKAKALMDLVRFHYSKAPLESIAYGEELLDLAYAINSKEYIYLGHTAIGVGHAIESSSADKALYHLLKALEVANAQEGEKWKLRRSKTHLNISGVHYSNGNIPQALNYAYEYVKQLENSQNTSTLAAAYESVALMHQSAETWDSVYFYLNKAKALYETTGEIHRQMAVELIEGEALSSNGDYTSALEIFKDLFVKANEQQDTVVLMGLYPQLSNVYLHLGEIDSAKLYARSGLQMVVGRSLIWREADQYEVLSDIFAVTEQYDSALYYFKAYANAKEKKLNKEKAKAVQEMEARYQLKQRAEENKRLKASISAEKAQNILLLISSILFLFLIFTIIVFYARLRNRKMELEKLSREIFQINSRLLALINEKKHMVSLIAHDIRNPLSLIQLNTFALADDNNPSLTADGRKEMLNEIEAATNAIDQASLKIMEIENKSDQPIPIQTDNFDISSPLLDAQRQFLAYAKSKNIRLRFELSSKKHFIKGDPFLFRHIVANFVSNALKYSPQGTEVRVALEEVKGQVAIKVIDQGPGLSKEDQQKIFEKGTTAANMPTAGERQLGEGLYLTRRYIEAMNGQVEIQSQLGKGTIFTLFFPKTA